MKNINTNNIYNMDCVEGMKQMKDKSVDVSFTSPPYNRRRNDKYKHYNDDNNDYYKLLIDSTDEMLRVTRGYTIVNIQQNMYNKKELFEYLGHYAELINGMYIWEKTNPTPSMNYNKESNDYSITNAFEYFIFIKDGKTFRANDKVKNIITTSVNNERFEGHGAVMKMSVCNHFIEQFSKEGDVILDPFSGMATTAISARHNKRNYIGFELSKDFHEASLRRIEEEFMQSDIFDFL